MTTDVRLSLELTDTAENAVFERFFAGYERSFTLPDETENREGFARCLLLNHGDEHARLAKRFGAFHELCVVATDARTDEKIGGANFIALAPSKAGDPVTANLNYLYVCPQARGQGMLRPFVQSLSDLIGSLFTSNGIRPVAIFIEQNDPFRMTREAYERDSKHTGTDQFARLRIWAKIGAQVVDFPYVQPALSQTQAPDETLVYSVTGAAGSTLDPAVLRHHLAGFFGVSVLKGASLENVPVVKAQLDALDAMIVNGGSIRLLDPRPFLDAPMDPSVLIDGPNRPQDLRSVLASSMRS